MFHDKLKKMRKKQDLTQQELADALGLDRTTITKYEKGITLPPMEMVKKLCAYFNVSVDYMLETQLDGQSITGLDKRVLILQRAADENDLNDKELQDILNYAKYRYPDRFKGISDDENDQV